jgi:hypothetical protein
LSKDRCLQCQNKQLADQTKEGSWCDWHGFGGDMVNQPPTS